PGFQRRAHNGGKSRIWVDYCLGSIATNKCIQRLDPMYQAGLLEEVECAIHRDWGCIVAVGADGLQQVICLDRFMAIPDQFQNTPAHGCEAPPLWPANSIGTCQSIADTGGTVMLVVCK